MLFSIRAMSAPTPWPAVVPQFVALASLPPLSGQAARGNLPAAMELPEWIELLTAARLGADRAGCPDLLGQLRAAVDQNIEAVIVTALDSDPALRFQAAVAATWPRQVIAGARFLGRACRARQVYLAVERDAPREWTRALRRVAFEHSVRLVELPNDYPQADPTLIIYTLTGRRLAPGKAPATCRAIVADAPAAAAIGRWANGDGPVTWTPCAVLDHRNGKSAFLRIPRGMPVGQVLESAQFHLEGGATVVGDLLRDRRATWEDRVGTGELVLHLIQRDDMPNPSPCIRCGWCVELCPTGVHPARLLEAAQRNDPALAERAGRRACIECGICAFACPSNLPLLDAIRRTPFE